MQGLTLEFLNHSFSSSLITLLAIVLTWYPLVVLGMFLLSQRIGRTDMQEKNLFHSLAILPSFFLGVLGLMLGPGSWEMIYAASGNAIAIHHFQIIELIAIYLAIPAGITGMLCGFLLFRVTWNDRIFLLSFFLFFLESCGFLVFHAYLYSYAERFSAPDLAGLLTIWLSLIAFSLPAVAISIFIVRVFERLFAQIRRYSFVYTNG